MRHRALRMCRIALLVTTMLWGGAAASAAASAEVAADDVSLRIDEFHAVLLEVMRSGQQFEGRAATLAPVVGELFDIPTISRISLGRSWKTLDETSQNDFSVLLEELIVATYADRFENFSGQSFHRQSVETARRGWVVKTELEKSDGKRVNLDYYFRGGKVFDVVADGVSDLSLRRADYNSIIKTQGYDQLLSHIQKNIAKRKVEDAED